MGHKWVNLKPPAPAPEPSKEGPRVLLKGVKWGEFFNVGGDLVIEGNKFSLRIGFFFSIPACCILHKGKYVVLRKISKKAWDKWVHKHVLVSVHDPFPGSPLWKKEPTGNWWYHTPWGNMELYTSMPREGYIFERSKFDLLRKQP